MDIFRSETLLYCIFNFPNISIEVKNMVYQIQSAKVKTFKWYKFEEIRDSTEQ